MIQKHSTSKLATKLKFQQTQQKVATKIIVFSTLGNKLQEMHNGMSSQWNVFTMECLHNGMHSK